MGLGNPPSGYSSNAEFTVAGIPWVTSSVCTGVTRFDFQHVTRTLMVKNASGATNVRVSFTERGQTTNYFDLSPLEAFSGELRISKLWVSGSGNTVAILAGTTTISTATAPILTGSTGLQGVG